MNVGEAHRQVQRFHREVTQGAYIFYPNDIVSMPDRSSGDVSEILRLRHGLAVMDEYGRESFRGHSRGDTLDRLGSVWSGGHN